MEQTQITQTYTLGVEMLPQRAEDIKKAYARFTVQDKAAIGTSF